MPQRLIYIWKAALLLVTLSLVASSAGCREKSNSPTPTIQQSTIEEGNVTITFAGLAAQRSLYEPLMVEFHRQHPEINVQFVEISAPSGGSNSESLKGLASSADTVIFTSEDSRKAGSAFKDLQPLIDADPAFQADDFWQGALSACQDSQGSLLGIPLTLGLHGIYFIEQAFTEANLPLPQPGWSWDDFRKDVSALASQQGGDIRYGFADENSTYTSILGPLVDAALVESDGAIDSTALQTRLGWYFDLASKKALFPMQEAGAGQPARQALFQSSIRPVLWTGYLAASLPWSTSSAASSDPWAGMALSSLGFVPFPVEGNADHTTPAYTYCAAISAGSQHLQAAWAWVSFLSNQWVSQPELGAYGIAQAPARQSVAEAVGYWSKLPEKAVPVVRYGLEHAWFGPVYPQAFGEVQAAIVQATEGKSKFTAALAEAQVSTGSEPTPQATEFVVATAQPTVLPDQVVIDFVLDSGSFSEGERYAVEALADEFNRQHPELMVNVKPAREETNTTLETLANQADCFSASLSPMGSSGVNDYLLSLDAFIAGEDPAFIKDYPTPLLDMLRVGGDMMGLPATVNPPVMLYNATLLEEHGLQLPTNDWTFDDFIRLATAAAGPALTPSAAAENSYGYSTWDRGALEFFLNGRGVDWLDMESDPPMVKLDSPEMISSLATIIELGKSGVFSFNAGQETFSGQVAFWESVAGRNPDSLNWGEPFKFGVAPLPIQTDNSYYNYFEVAGFYISKETKNPQGCWEWIRYLTEQPDIFLGIPARQSVAASPAWEAKVGKANADVYRSALAKLKLGNGLSYAQQKVSMYMDFIFLGEVADKVITQGMDLQPVLAETQAKAESFLSCMVEAGYETLNQTELNNMIGQCLDKANPGNK